MKLKPVLLAVSALLALPAMADNLTVVNFGGANGAAQKIAYIEPFEKAGGKVTAVEYNGEQAKIKAMVEAKNVTWDVVEVESPDLSRGCDEGLFETIDWSKIGNKADFQKAAVHECGVGTFVWSTVMAYDGDKLKTAPTTWADFWDVKKFPGKRGLRKGARYNLEFALMADGVKPADVYKVLATKDGAERAFKKLTELKPNIQWWEAGAQPPQFLVAGDVSHDHRLQRPHRRRPARRQEPENHLDRRHLRPGLLGHAQGHAQQGRGPEVHRLGQLARCSGRIRQEHQLRSDQQQGAGQARRQGAGHAAHLASQQQGCAAVRHRLLGRPG